MIIKEITIQKSRTIDLNGVGGRNIYRKITVGMTAELEGDEGNSTTYLYRNAYTDLSSLVDEALKREAQKIKESLTKK